MWTINPYLALFYFGILSLVVVYVFYPNIGLIAKYKRSLLNTKRILLEDALKHIYDYESSSLNATINSIAGNLGISADKSSKIVQNLKNLNLILFNNQIISLTDDGRKYALRVIRIHRLWENYLAEETGVKEIDWHDEAEKVEHLLTQEDANILSAKMGNPKFDPHGDPIPATDGTIRYKKGNLLNTIEAGKTVKITHIEDEPKSIYVELLDQGMYPGKELKILEKTDTEIKIAFDGYEKFIPLLNASKVTASVIEDREFINEKVKTLIELKPGNNAEIISIAPNCRGQQRRRLLDFGIVPGTKISVHMDSPLNDPKAYLVKETIVALRNDQASKILIK